MNNQTINMLWVHGRLPWYAQASILSFLHHGNSVALYTYNTSIDVPKGCSVIDAEEVLPKESVFTYKEGFMKGHLSGFADWFRYELLLKAGGWWSDVDVICVSRFFSSKDFVFASGWEADCNRYVNNNVIYVSRPGAPIMEAAAAECRRLGSNVAHAQTGPVLLHELVNSYSLGGCVDLPDVYNPISYRDINRITKSQFYWWLLKRYRIIRGRLPILINDKTKCVHLYSAILQTSIPSTEKIGLPKNSFLYDILLRNGAIEVVI